MTDGPTGTIWNWGVKESQGEGGGRMDVDTVLDSRVYSMGSGGLPDCWRQDSEVLR